MSDDNIKFLVEIEHRLPKEGELLTSYAHEISKAFDKQLQNRMPELLYELARAWEEGKLHEDRKADGRITLRSLKR